MYITKQIKNAQHHYPRGLQIKTRMINIVFNLYEGLKTGNSYL